MKRVCLREVAPQAWRNGGGTTQELLAWPAAADGHGWHLRVSVARIAQDGPFSAYPGVTRHFGVLAGAGVGLSFGERLLELTPKSEPLAFDGEAAPGCRLLGGATDDFNFMAQADAGRSHLQRAEPGRAWQPHARWRGLYTHEAALLEHAGNAWPLEAGTLLWTDDAQAPAWTLHAAHAGHAFWMWLEEPAR